MITQDYDSLEVGEKCRDTEVLDMAPRPDGEHAAVRSSFAMRNRLGTDAWVGTLALLAAGRAAAA